jgi:hypothetical protein
VKYDPQMLLSRFPAHDQPHEPVPQIFKKVGQIPCSISIKAFKEVVEKLMQTGEIERLDDRIHGSVFRQSN